jgi:hypothetical protein
MLTGRRRWAKRKRNKRRDKCILAAPNRTIRRLRMRYFAQTAEPSPCIFNLPDLEQKLLI